MSGVPLNAMRVWESGVIALPVLNLRSSWRWLANFTLWSP